ncbi:MAG: hypothetical protein AB7E05_14260 [Sphingobium sp.]
MDGVIRRHIARNRGDALDFAGQGGGRFGRDNSRFGDAALRDENRGCPGILGIDEGGAARIGDGQNQRHRQILMR